MKLTQTKKVADIVRPPVEGIPQALFVAITDPVMRAVELMLKNDVTQIAVVGQHGLTGHVQLDDALRHLGLSPPGPLADPAAPSKADKAVAWTKPH
jgi:hypothetical protein